MQADRDSVSEGEKETRLVTSKINFPQLISDFEAIYTRPDQKSTWLNKIGRNWSYSLKSCFSFPLKTLFLAGNNSIYVLGREFKCVPALKTVYKKCKKRLREVVWVSYRSDFRPMTSKFDENALLTTDSGWGCTVRVGQMLLLNTLKRHFQLKHTETHEVIRLIEENLLQAPLSIHNLVMISEEHDAGSWFSPSAVSHSISNVLKLRPIHGFRCCVFMDSLICKDEIVAQACEISFEEAKMMCLCELGGEKNGEVCERCGGKQGKLEWKNGVLVMMPLMMGVRKIQKEYRKAFKGLLKCKFSMGIIGGKPKSALYLVGYKQSSVIYFDPHYVQRAHNSLTDFKRHINTYHCREMFTADIVELESSISAGFYFRDMEAFCEFERFIGEKSYLKDFVVIKDKTPNYLMAESLPIEENEEGFIIFS
jgi:cysteine protease ATG4